ncbi:2-methoxy-6-polyprenyl-1,4-benzoquinol methylase, mitochondrial [Vibrio stylophorae]|uniref:2-methoxy-6-polyprenyl-1,4-benzoquinol methylase, mitochondrial n=1 Tax=Vibrio stylophorae TaxID=659351 RepID=A0ABM8ZS69_9VIBR|nr:class I SAM-dependent methyltransferase [Vibrio stylophorae]CAH0533150.1 2-methoxy-6-polyprenyl-1,4-benzoquinol methylase, mitochondrial [Vibrio stylophorae]
MSEEYNDVISRHYAAYRPPLHQLILAKALASMPAVTLGLDIGCGTGVSSRALQPYYRKIIAIDPSEAMIAKAHGDSNIEYRVGCGEQIDLPEQSVDLVTFAGSLFYAKSPALVTELVRVLKPQAVVLAYDFEVNLDVYLALFDIALNRVQIDYDHAINFDDCPSFQAIDIAQSKVALPVSAQEIAHVLLSSTARYEALSEKFGQEDPFDAMVAVLHQHAATHQIEAEIYYSRYQYQPLL